MQQPVNAIGSSLPPAEPIYKALFKFVDEALPNFMPLSKKGDGEIVDAEDDISEDLADYLDSLQEEKTNGFFKFCNQSKHSDIGVKYGRKYNDASRPLICWIEAKRLPTPPMSNRDPREYVYVDKEKYHGGGGIQRFKINKHGPNLPYAIMIGYIQEYTCEYWYHTINNYISELAKTNSLWSIRDCLKKNEKDRFTSVHSRTNNKKEVISDITIYHYWITL